MDEESRRIAALLEKLSGAERLIYRNLLVVGAHFRYQTRPEPRARAFTVADEAITEPIIIGEEGE